MDSSPTPPEGQSDEFETWELELAKQVIRDFLASRLPSPGLEFDDLLQECLLHWWRQRNAYKETRGASPKTYMRTVLRAKLLDIERAAKAGKRGGGRSDHSFDSPFGTNEEGSTLRDVIPDTKPHGDPEKVAERSALLQKINSVRRKLDLRQRRLLDGLMVGSSMTELSRQLGVPRPTLYGESARIRKTFRDEGLEEFLR